MQLNQQTAVITGSSRGIGRAIALRMAQEGARVVVNGTDASRVNEVVEEIHQNGGVAIGIAESVHTMKGGPDHLCGDGGVRPGGYPGEQRWNYPR